MSSGPDDGLRSFAVEIGWKANLLATDNVNFSNEWWSRLDELIHLYGRPASWTSDAVGTIEYKETGERWLAQFRTFIDGERIWRLYERLEPNPERPAFRLTRRDSDKKWEDMGYFSKSSSRWTFESNTAMSSLVSRVVN